MVGTRFATARTRSQAARSPPPMIDSSENCAREMCTTDRTGARGAPRLVRRLHPGSPHVRPLQHGAIVAPRAASASSIAPVSEGAVTQRAARAIAVFAALALIALVATTQGDAQVPGPLNDLGALSQGTGQTPEKAAVQTNPEPPLTATPRAKCLPGSKPEPDVQGRVPEGSAANGLNCNVEQLAHQGTSGGFKVYRYIDAQGQECAYYDTALLFPLNAFNPAGTSRRGRGARHVGSRRIPCRRTTSRRSR